MYYTESDFINCKKQTRTRVILAFVLLAAVIGIMVVGYIYRLQALVLITAALGFIAFYFLWYFKVGPWVKYNRFLKEMKQGQKRTLDCRFIEFDPSTRLYDGVEVHDVLVTVGTEEKDERLFILDADKKLPELEKDCNIRVTSFGNFVLDIEKI